MAGSKEQGHFEKHRVVYLGGLAVIGFIVWNALHGDADIDQAGDAVSGRVRRQLAEALAENKTYAAQNAALEKQNEAFEKQIAELNKKYDALEKRFEDVRSGSPDRSDDMRRGRYRDDWYDERRPRGYSRPRYYGRPPFIPERDYYLYGAGGSGAYPIEYGRPQYGPYRYPWWDDRYYGGPQQHPYYGGRHPQYPMGPRGGGAVRIGASFPIGDNGRINIGLGFPIGRRYY